MGERGWALDHGSKQSIWDARGARTLWWVIEQHSVRVTFLLVGVDAGDRWRLNMRRRVKNEDMMPRRWTESGEGWIKTCVRGIWDRAVYVYCTWRHSERTLVDGFLVKPQNQDPGRSLRRTWPKTGTIVDREKIPDRRAARSRDAMVLDGRIADIEIVCRGGWYCVIRADYVNLIYVMANL